MVLSKIFLCSLLTTNSIGKPSYLASESLIQNMLSFFCAHRRRAFVDYCNPIAAQQAITFLDQRKWIDHFVLQVSFATVQRTGSLVMPVLPVIPLAIAVVLFEFPIEAIPILFDLETQKSLHVVKHHHSTHKVDIKTTVPDWPAFAALENRMKELCPASWLELLPKSVDLSPQKEVSLRFA